MLSRITPSLFLALALSIAASSATAQSTDPLRPTLPATTDCPATEPASACLQALDYAYARQRRYDERLSVRTGMRATGWFAVAIAVPQFIGGITMATRIPPHTNATGYSVAMTANGALLTSLGFSLAFIDPDEPTSYNRASVGGLVALGAVNYSLAALHTGLAAWGFLSQPQDVAPEARYIFAASMAADALFYFGNATYWIAHGAIARARSERWYNGSRATVRPYAAGTQFGLVGSF